MLAERPTNPSVTPFCHGRWVVFHQGYCAHKRSILLGWRLGFMPKKLTADYDSIASYRLCCCCSEAVVF